MKTIYVLVGKRVRSAQARFNATGTIAIIDTSSGPVEFKRWYSSQSAAEAAVNKRRAA